MLIQKFHWVAILGVTVSCLPGCNGSGRPAPSSTYVKTVKSAATALPEAVEMEKLFGKGNVDHFIEHFGMGDERWNSEVCFGGRYRLTMQVDITVDRRQHLIIPKSEPVFYLVEYHRVDLLSDGRTHAHLRAPTGRKDQNFSSDEWKMLYENGGDVATIGVKPSKNPVANFDEHTRQGRRDRVPVISLLEN